MYKKSIALVFLSLTLSCSNPFGDEDSIGVNFSPKGDSQPPTEPIILGQTGNATLTSSPTITWEASTDNIGVTNYELAIGSSVGSDDVVSFTSIDNVTSHQFTGLTTNLAVSTNYYISVKAKDKAKNESQTVSSSAFTVALSLNSSAYQYPDGSHGDDCKAYLDSGYYDNEGNGFYRIDPDGTGGSTAFVAYCDMTTDSGGWTLIGRGRENWSWDNNGANTANVINDLGTTSGFVPAYYSATVVDDIIDKNTSTLIDGLRIKRSLDTTGSTYQEGRWFFTSQTTFTWLYDTTLPLSNINIDGVDYGANDSRDTSEDGNDERRFFTWLWGSHGVVGFSFGSAISAGTNSPTNFLWENATENHSIPYTEVYVRE